MHTDNLTPKEISGFGRAIKWIRIVFIVCIVLLFFYMWLCFKIFAVPDDYVMLHPFVLPGEHWVYKKSQSIHKSLFKGDIALFYPSGASDCHVSLVIGLPGQKIEYLSVEKRFRVEGALIKKDFSLSKEWADAPYEMIILGNEEFLLIDNNAFPGEKRFWKVKKGDLTGKFLFRMPF